MRSCAVYIQLEYAHVYSTHACLKSRLLELPHILNLKVPASCSSIFLPTAQVLSMKWIIPWVYRHDNWHAAKAYLDLRKKSSSSTTSVICLKPFSDCGTTAAEQRTCVCTCTGSISSTTYIAVQTHTYTHTHAYIHTSYLPNPQYNKLNTHKPIFRINWTQHHFPIVLQCTL